METEINVAYFLDKIDKAATFEDLTKVEQEYIAVANRDLPDPRYSLEYKSDPRLEDAYQRKVRLLNLKGMVKDIEEFARKKEEEEKEKWEKTGAKQNLETVLKELEEVAGKLEAGETDIDALDAALRTFMEGVLAPSIETDSGPEEAESEIEEKDE